MNCKQGQLVRYVGSNPFNRPNIYGWIGTTMKPCNWGCTDGWIVDPPLPGGTIATSHGIYPPEGVQDASLKPIDNPGDDAVDEVVQRLGTPHKEVA